MNWLLGLALIACLVWFRRWLYYGNGRWVGAKRERLARILATGSEDTPVPRELLLPPNLRLF